MPHLLVLRGPSGSGKSTIARTLRAELGRRTTLVEQDQIRRTLLWEWDEPGGLAPQMIDLIARASLGEGRHTVVEGILAAERYGDMFRALIADHDATVVYLDVPFVETLARHADRPQAADFTPEQMAEWWLPDDRLGVPGEVVHRPPTSVARIVDDLRGRFG